MEEKGSEIPSSSPRLRRYSSPPRERARGVVSVAKDCVSSSPSEEGEEWEAGGGEVKGLGEGQKEPVANGGICSMVASRLSSAVSGEWGRMLVKSYMRRLLRMPKSSDASFRSSTPCLERCTVCHKLDAIHWREFSCGKDSGEGSEEDVKGPGWSLCCPGATGLGWEVVVMRMVAVVMAAKCQPYAGHFDYVTKFHMWEGHDQLSTASYQQHQSQSLSARPKPRCHDFSASPYRGKKSSSLSLSDCEDLLWKRSSVLSSKYSFASSSSDDSSSQYGEGLAELTTSGLRAFISWISSTILAALLWFFCTSVSFPFLFFRAAICRVSFLMSSALTRPTSFLISTTWLLSSVLRGIFSDSVSAASITVTPSVDVICRNTPENTSHGMGL
ncbi:hypothetical protein CRUP_019810 [Coryphaenoides rupestris]|nr:hypothetical protein CRUP_019810 [Coryphaenoides rupestris]